METKDLKYIEEYLIKNFDGRYRKIEDCEDTIKEIRAEQEELREGLSKHYTRLAVIESQLKLILWVLMAVGGGIITMLIKMFFGS